MSPPDLARLTALQESPRRREHFGGAAFQHQERCHVDVMCIEGLPSAW
jgi:hypothetical protein